MEPVRSSLGGGAVATVVLTAFLLVADFVLQGANLFVFATFASLCAVSGPPYCAPGTPLAAGLTFVWYVALFAIGWPLLFGGFTWGLPGEAGSTHGAIFGLILWVGYAVSVLYVTDLGGRTPGEDLPLVVVSGIAYLVYGLVLGGVYDRLADHRTFLSSGT